MAEALAVVSVVASIAQLVELTGKVITRLNEFRSNVEEVPRSLVHMHSQLGLLTSTLSRIKDHESGKQENDPSLHLVILNCQQQIARLDSLLTKNIPAQEESRSKRIYKSIKSVFDDGNSARIYQNFEFSLPSFVVHPEPRHCVDNKLIKIRAWLSAPDPSANYQKARKLRHPDTGQWFLQSSHYSTWSTKACSFLWLHGIPGCGKTILTSTIIEDIIKSTEDEKGHVVIYFFFTFNDRLKQDPELMVRSLITQLSRNCIKIPPFLSALFDSCDKGEIQPSLDDLVGVLRQMIDEFPHVLLVFDALDECRDCADLMSIIKTLAGWELPGLHTLVTSRREWEIENSLKDILQPSDIISIESAAVNQDIHAYVHQKIREDTRFRMWHKNHDEIASKLTKGAQGMFRWVVCQLEMLRKCCNLKDVRAALENLPLTLDETYNRILAAISPNYMRYAVRILRWLAFSYTPLRISEIAEIAALDPDRDQAFEADEILPDPTLILDICSSLVSIVPQNYPKWDDYRPHGPEVVLSHYSVKEYLLSDRIQQSRDYRVNSFAMEAAACHRFILECCLQYLLQCSNISNQSLDETISHEDILDEDSLDGGNSGHALAIYSAWYWISHARMLKDDFSCAHSLIIKLFTNTNGSYLNWARLCGDSLIDPVDTRPAYRIKESSKSPVHVASVFGMNEIVRYLVTEAGLNEKNYLDDALEAASLEGRVDTVNLLLELGAKPDVAVLCNIIRSRPINEKEILAILIEHGADVNAEGRIAMTRYSPGGEGPPLVAAASRNDGNLVELLIEKGAKHSINYSKRGYYTNALQIAAALGFVDVVRVLLDGGADANARSEPHGNALCAAVDLMFSLGDDATIQLLLTHGADVNAQGVGVYGCALSTASAKGLKACVQLFIKKGAEINALVPGYHSALQYAAAHGHLDIVVLLLQEGADINVIPETDSFSALELATIGGHNETARVLIDYRARFYHLASTKPDIGTARTHRTGGIMRISINSPIRIKKIAMGSCGILLLAASRQQEAIIQLLLQSGAEINTQSECRYIFTKTGDSGGSLGSQAPTVSEFSLDARDVIISEDGFSSENGYASRSYLSIHDPRSRNRRREINTFQCWSTALCLAALQGYEQIALLLLDRGAHVNIPGDNVVSPLQLAVLNGNQNLANILIKNGADVNAKAVIGSSLFLAAREGHHLIALDLLDHGARVNDENGWSEALEVAILRRGSGSENGRSGRDANISTLGSDDKEIEDHAEETNELEAERTYSRRSSVESQLESRSRLGTYESDPVEVTILVRSTSIEDVIRALIKKGALRKPTST